MSIRRNIKRAMIAMASAGWLVPFCLSFWASYDFLWNVVWPVAVTGDTNQLSPFHLFGLADELFYLSAAWCAVVIIAWSIRLTR